jgi:hypothetical protein
MELIGGLVYDFDEGIDHKRLAKFAEYLKDELPKKMRADMESDLQPLPEWLRTSLQVRIGEIARICTEKVFDEYQRPNPSFPPTPVMVDRPNPIDDAPLESTFDQIQEVVPENAIRDCTANIFGIRRSETENDDHFSDLLSSLPPLDLSEWDLDLPAPDTSRPSY